ncbi:MAG: threonylcarbamoyl-AMP synthase [Flavobacteriales bacterium]|nr:threonylcarbamoyl-AMP synthase [Flavobacteriales bacterium]
MILEIRPENPDERSIDLVAETLNKGGLVVLPTDSVYAVMCKLSNLKGIEQLARQRGKKIHKANFSLVCRDFSSLSKYSQSISNPVFKLMKQVLPGPFTFILTASHEVPKLFRENKKTIGIRILKNTIVQAILDKLDEPLVATSIHSEDEVTDYITDPYEIDLHLGNQVQMVVDAGAGGIQASTVIDCSGAEPELVRQGIGEL